VVAVKRFAEVKIVDQAPPGWFVLDLMRRTSRSHSWVALMIDVDPDGHCSGACRARASAWVAIPGKHRDRDAAWDALADMLQTRH
jgi:hypothetical protein